MSLHVLGGRLCEVAYTIPYFPLLISFTPIKGGGACALVPLSYASASGAARIFQRGPKRGSEATERGECVGGVVSPSHSREIFFWKFVYENGIFLHIKCYY